MGSIAAWFGESISGFVDSVTNLLDKTGTTDHERGQIKVALEELKTAAVAKAQKYEAKLAAEMTERWKADMASDSWLSKNIRPGVLLLTAVGFFGILIASIITEVPVTTVDAALWAFGTALTLYIPARQTTEFLKRWQQGKK